MVLRSGYTNVQGRKLEREYEVHSFLCHQLWLQKDGHLRCFLMAEIRMDFPLRIAIMQQNFHLPLQKCFALNHSLYFNDLEF